MRILTGPAGRAAIAASCILTLSSPAAAAPAAQVAPAASVAVEILQDVCLPLLHGGDFDRVVKSVGLRQEHGQWELPLGGGRRVDLEPPDVANPHVCSATIIHRVGDQAAIREAVDAWAQAQSPRLEPIKVQQRSLGPTYMRTTSTWASQTSNSSIGVALSEEKTAAGQPVLGDSDQTELLASVTPS